jgi:hypothetical protein
MQIGYHPLPCHEIPKIDELLNIEQRSMPRFSDQAYLRIHNKHETKRKCTNMWA